LIELLIVIAIIGIMSAVVLPGYRKGSLQLALSRSSHKLSQDLRRAQEMGMSPRSGGSIAKGYGIHFPSNDSTSYILFADFDGEHDYDGISELIEGPIEFEREVRVSSFSPSGSQLTVVFIPPLPSVEITPSAPSASITITNGEQLATVSINKVGLIEIVNN